MTQETDLLKELYGTEKFKVGDDILYDTGGKTYFKGHIDKIFYRESPYDPKLKEKVYQVWFTEFHASTQDPKPYPKEKQFGSVLREKQLIKYVPSPSI